MNSRRAEILWVASLALLLVASLHRPLWMELGVVLPGEDASDVYRAHWSAWLLGQEFPGWPFSTTRVQFPVGVDLLPFPAISLWLLAPLTRVLGPDVALPLLVMAYSGLAFAAAYALVRTLGGAFGGAVLAGVLLATQPILGGSLRDGTLEIQAVAWLPLGMLALVKAARGSFAWGAFSGLLAVVIAMESAYFASFSVLAALGVASLVRRRRGVYALGIALAVAAAGAVIVALLFSPVLDNAAVVLAGTGDDMDLVRHGNAATFDTLWQLALSPGSRGWRVSDLYGPPLAHWILFGVGALVCARRLPFLGLLGLAYVLLAVDHSSVSWWVDTRVGEIVRFPRRYMIAVAVVLSTAAGVGLRTLLPWPRVERWGGLVLALYLGLWGAHAGGWVKGYPLTRIPETPAFAEALRQDREDCAALLVPVELPVDQGGEQGERKRHEMPVFAEISRVISSSDQLFLQTRTGKSGWSSPSLVTLAKREDFGGRFAKALTDLARAKVGNPVPNSARAPADLYTDEVDWLRGEGLKYVVVDLDRYEGEELLALEAVLEAFAVATTDYDDGTGVRVYQIYESRPESLEAPDFAPEGVPSGFSGKVTNHRDFLGRTVVVLDVGEREVICPIGPIDGSFLCGGIHRFQGMWVRVDDREHEVERSEGIENVEVRILPIEEQP